MTLAFAVKKFPNFFFFWNRKVCYHVDKISPFDVILSQLNLVHNLTSYFFKHHLSFSHIFIHVQSDSSSSGFEAKILSGKLKEE